MFEGAAAGAPLLYDGKTAAQLKGCCADLGAVTELDNVTVTDVGWDFGDVWSRLRVAKADGAGLARPTSAASNARTPPTRAKSVMMGVCREGQTRP